MGFWRSKTVVITGGAGFIGSHLVDALMGKCRSLSVVDAIIDDNGVRKSIVRTWKTVRWINARIEDIEHWGELLSDADVVFDLAAVNNHQRSMSAPVEDYTVNSLGHLKLGIMCRSLNRTVRIVYASSRSVYGRGSGRPFHEADRPEPLDYYSVHTLLNEHYYRLASGGKVSTCCVRFGNTYGPRQRLQGEGIGVLGEMFRNALRGHPLEVYGDGSSKRDIMYVADIVDALMKMGESGWEEPFVVVNAAGHPVALNEFARTICGYTGSSISYRPFPDHLQTMNVGDVALDGNRIRELCGWYPTTSIGEGIHKALTFFKTHPEYWSNG
jgi:nucleoside-diphosphate-sugar epimerase